MKVILYSLRKHEEIQAIEGSFDIVKIEKDLWKNDLEIYKPHVEWLNNHQYELWITIKKKNRRRVVEIIEGCQI